MLALPRGSIALSSLVIIFQNHSYLLLFQNEFELYNTLHDMILGLQQWEEARAMWLHHNKASDTDSTARAAAPLEVDEIIDVIFSPRWRQQGDEDGPPRRFPQNVPLPQMVDILVDLWEAEGLAL